MAEKILTTRPKMQKAFSRIFQVGYCRLQSVLFEQSPRFYTKGQLGWNNDIYVLDCDTILVTGYRSTFGTPLDPKKVSEFEGRAHQQLWESKEPYQTRYAKTREIYNEFLNYIKTL